MVLGTTPTQRQLLGEQGYNNLFGLTLGQPGYSRSPNKRVHTPIFPPKIFQLTFKIFSPTSKQKKDHSNSLPLVSSSVHMNQGYEHE